jgi:hypothetical protein
MMESLGCRWQREAKLNPASVFGKDWNKAG